MSPAERQDESGALEARLEWWRRYAIAATGLAGTILLMWLMFVTTVTVENRERIAVATRDMEIQLPALTQAVRDVADAQRETAREVALLAGTIQASQAAKQNQ